MSLTVQQLSEIERGTLWLLNTADNVVEGGGDINIVIYVNSQPQMLRVPKSWLPVDATKTIPRRWLLESQQLMSAISLGTVAALSEEEAQELNSRPGANFELSRMRDEAARQRQAVATKGIGKNVFISSGTPEDEEDEEVLRTAAPTKTNRNQQSVPRSSAIDLSNLSAEDDAQAEEADTVSVGFKGWVQKLNSMQSTEERLNAIRNRSKLSADEAVYLRDNLADTRIVASLTAKIKS